MIVTLLRTFWLVIAYIITSRTEVTNKGDMNRKAWVMDVSEGFFYFIGFFILFFIIAAIVKACNFRARNYSCLIDTFGFFGCCLLTFCVKWVIWKFWEGVYVNSDLTEA